MYTSIPSSLPSQPGALNLEQLQRDERRSTVVLATLMLTGILLDVLLSLVTRSPILGAAAVAGILVIVWVPVWLWRAPVRGTYVLFGAAVLLATYVQDDLTGYFDTFLPFFRDIKSYTHVGLVFSIAEVFMVLVLAIWLLKAIAERNLRFDRGTMMIPLVLYVALALVGEARGLTTGGSFRDSLFELRGQVYMPLLYVLVCNLVKNRQQVTGLMWALIVGAGLRGIEGTFQYVFVLRAQDISTHQLYPHEQSYFFNGFITLALLLRLNNGPKRMRRVIFWLMPFVFIANLANNRRASILALVLSLIVLALVVWITRPEHRRVIAWGAVLLAIVFPPYYVHYQNKTGFLALPARAISSNFHPSAEDASSDLYRVYEDLDIMATVKSSPIIGYGFGKPMLSPYPLPNINYGFQYLMPHNSILWVWMRLGTFGYLVLWFLIGTAVMQSTALVRRLKDPYLQSLALFVLLMIIQQVVISYVDLQWSNYRTMIATGVLFALVSSLSRIEASEARSWAARRSKASIGAPTRPTLVVMEK